jgi:hypothetical protein
MGRVTSSFIHYKNEKSNELDSTEGKKERINKARESAFLIYHSIATPSAIQPREQDA